MSGLVNIGFGNMINSEKVIAVVNPDAAPIKRMVQSARETQRVIDASQGRRTKSVIMMENGQIVLSAMQPDTIARRFAAVHSREATSQTDMPACTSDLSEQEMKGEES